MFHTHFCSDKCKQANKPRDLCQAQRRKLQSDTDLANNVPTLRYQPFCENQKDPLTTVLKQRRLFDMTITEADRATARRIIRRHAGVHERATVRTTMDPRRGFCEVMRSGARVVLGYGP